MGYIKHIDTNNPRIKDMDEVKIKYVIGFYGSMEKWIDIGYGWQYQCTFSLVE